MIKSGAIYSCKNCGEYKQSKSVHCQFCKTAKQRKEMNEENEKIKERLSKVFVQ